MATYTPIANSEIDPESPITSSLMSRLRDNPIAISEGQAGAPKIVTAALADLGVTAAKMNIDTRTIQGTTSNGHIIINGTILINWRSFINLAPGGTQTLNWNTAFGGVLMCIAGKNFTGQGYNAAAGSVDVESHSNTNVTIRNSASGGGNQAGYVFAIGTVP